MKELIYLKSNPDKAMGIKSVLERYAKQFQFSIKHYTLETFQHENTYYYLCDCDLRHASRIYESEIHELLEEYGTEVQPDEFCVEVDPSRIKECLELLKKYYPTVKKVFNVESLEFETQPMYLYAFFKDDAEPYIAPTSYYDTSYIKLQLPKKLTTEEKLTKIKELIEGTTFVSNCTGKQILEIIDL